MHALQWLSALDQNSVGGADSRADHHLQYAHNAKYEHKES